MNESETRNHNKSDKKTAKSYDESPYPSYPFPETHPNKLASIAIMFGMTPAPVERCKVLELGCGSGNNLIGMAAELPDSEFTGIDLSINEVQIANNKISDLQLKNINILHKSITDITPDFGKFDYIITHGVYSWVPENVRDKILCICRDNLNKNGVAYVSYNTYPGWHWHEMVRNMMRYHLKDEKNPEVAVKKAREFLGFLSETVDPKTPAGVFIQSEAERVKLLPDNYYLHDQLAEINQPFYFYQFAEQLDKHDLKYVRECDIQASTSRNFSPKVSEMLNSFGDDIVNIEQHMDFFMQRQFRETIICHKDVDLQRLITEENIVDFYFVSSLRPKNPELNLSATHNEKFVSHRCPEISSSNPLSKAIWKYMAMSCPKPCSPDEITEGAVKLLEESNIPKSEYAPEADTRQYVLSNLLWGISMGFIATFLTPTRMITTVTNKPVTTDLIRYDAKHGNRIINLLHESIHIDNISHHILPLLDGSNDINAILEQLIMLVKNGTISIKKNNQPVTDAFELHEILMPQLHNLLAKFSGTGLLIG